MNTRIFQYLQNIILTLYNKLSATAAIYRKFSINGAPRVTYQNKIFDLTLLLFIMAVLRSIELKKFFGEFSDPPSPLKDFLR